jgi:SAM-dependent methyltransferase
LRPTGGADGVILAAVPTLPDVSRLGSLPTDCWGALGRRFRDVGFTSRACAPFAQLGALTPDPRHAALAKWHLRRLREPSAYAMRMMTFCDPVTPAEAREVLGDAAPLERLVDAGLLVSTDEGVVSAFVMRLLADLYVLSDDVSAGGEAVMGAAPSTKTLAGIARPRGRAGRALDLGCGAGTIALALAQRCDHVVATDISERAVTFARVNAALDGLPNIECRVGDLFEPVAGESFDVVASQPPFLPRDEETGPTTFLFGGPRGDEISTRVLRGLRAHLSPGASGFLLAEWPLVEGDAPVDERISEALGSPRNLGMLHLRLPDGSIDEHCARYATIEHPHGDADYERAAMRRREHFERMRIRALVPMVSVVRLDDARPGWVSVVEVGGSPMSRARVDGMMAARDMVARGRDAVRAARLRVPEGVAVPRDAVVSVVHASGCASTLPDEALEKVEEALLAGQLEIVDA